MRWSGVLWVAAAYLVATFPSTWVVARLTGARDVEGASRRGAGEADAHVVVASRLGFAWAAAAAAADVLKAVGVVAAARAWGGLDPPRLALVGVAVVAGHAFPPWVREMAGRGVAAAAGVYLVLLPVEMLAAGALIVTGAAVRTTSLATTIAMGAVPVIAAIQGQPGAFVALSAGVFVLLMLRRLEGAGDVIRQRDVGVWRAVVYRCVFDSSGPPIRSPVPGRGRGRRLEGDQAGR